MTAERAHESALASVPLPERPLTIVPESEEDDVEEEDDESENFSLVPLRTPNVAEIGDSPFRFPREDFGAKPRWGEPVIESCHSGMEIVADVVEEDIDADS